ncbi:MAG: PAS domain-containing protein [Proteobacteria bacterium]|nr:PAS domain-containing protein [Pseudomonadota bacterium]
MALLDAARAGALPPWRKSPPRDLEAAQAKAVAWFDEAHATSPNPAALIDPSPGLALVAVNGAFEQAASLSRDRIVGRPLFDLFPDNPNDPSADGVHNLYASLRMVADTGRAHQMALQRYDTQDASGVWNARYWRPVNTPLNDDDGALILLLHVVEEATGAEARTD